MEREKRAAALSKFASVAAAVEAGALGQYQDLSLSEAIVLGLINQGVRKFVAIFGHGTTDIAEVLRYYEAAGAVKTFNVRHETAAAHMATALRMFSGEKAAVITSIGPGAMQAFAGALAAASNGVGVYHIYGDETTQDEGFNMQQIPKDEQLLFLKLTGNMGQSYTLSDPWSLCTAMQRGAVATGRKGSGQPFFLLAPMNKQPEIMKNFNLLELPAAYEEQPISMCSEKSLQAAADIIRQAKKITIKIGGGARGCGREIVELAKRIDAAIVSGPSSCGIVPYSEQRYMTVGGSKGSLAGNYAMNEADLVVIIGARAVCQWDSSGTAWKKAKAVINFNINPYHATHYNCTTEFVGDAKANLQQLLVYLQDQGIIRAESEWTKEITAKKAEWEAFKNERYHCVPLMDEAFGQRLLTQPVAIKTVCDFAKGKPTIKYFDAGDIQANGFQIVEDETEGETITDTGASYMGFAVSAVMTAALSDKEHYPIAFTGDGSFMMNPQVLIDAVEHQARGLVVIFDNRRMAAISGLQRAQYGHDFKTNDRVAVDYVQLAGAVHGIKALFGGYSVAELEQALAESYAYQGLSVIHVPVYSGEDALGGMGVFGDWNVGNWCERVQAEHHRQGL